jgi:AGZA family xanthine/uracil permease-like MFS transporter
MVATILSAAFGTVVMGLYARRPFAIAPYMGENAFRGRTLSLPLPWSRSWGIPGRPRWAPSSSREYCSRC